MQYLKDIIDIKIIYIANNTNWIPYGLVQYIKSHYIDNSKDRKSIMKY